MALLFNCEIGYYYPELAYSIFFDTDLIQGQVIGGFVVPFPMASNASHIFKTFGLYHNRVGVCLPGTRHKSKGRGHQTAILNDYAMVGDFIDNKQIISAVNKFDPINKNYYVEFEYGTPPIPKIIPPKQFDYLNEINIAFKNIGDLSGDFLNDFFTTCLPLCLCPPGGNLVTTAAVAPFELLKADYLAKIEAQKTLLELKTWQI